MAIQTIGDVTLDPDCCVVVEVTVRVGNEATPRLRLANVTPRTTQPTDHELFAVVAAHLRKFTGEMEWPLATDQWHTHRDAAGAAAKGAS